MNKNYLRPQFFSGFLIVVLCQFSFAQSENFWDRVEENEVQNELMEIDDKPLNALYFSLDYNSLFNELDQTKGRFSKEGKTKVLDLPHPDGTFAKYEVFESDVMHPDLKAKYPNIRTYTGYNIKYPNEKLQITMTPKGLNATIFSAEVGTIHIEPMSYNSTYQMLYTNRDMSADIFNFTCDLIGEEDFYANYTGNSESAFSRNADDQLLRTYNYGIGTSFEFSDFHISQAGASNGTDEEKRAAVMVPIVELVSFANLLFENELSITFQLPSNGDAGIAIDENDGLTGDSNGTLLNEATPYLNSTIGFDNYDLGHILSAVGGGVAYLAQVCSPNLKGGSVSGPVQLNRVRGTFVHEMGHQFGSPHTFNADAGVCGNNRTASFAFEPGSGTTIMSYNGGNRCADQQISNIRDDYYHQQSLNIMFDFVSTSFLDCPVTTDTNNRAPVVDAGPDYVIPRNTPYKLVGSATDDGDLNALTYAWEQADLGESGVPSSSDIQGPQVRSFLPTTENVRYIPRLEDYLDTFGDSTEWEKIPSVARDLTFTLTVRDNDVRGGQVGVDQVTITVADEASRFRVRSQTGTSTVYEGGSEQEIRWSVANTDQAPINTTEVRILLSTDGGLNFDTVLLENTPNDGTAMVTMPNVDAQSCRVMVEAVGNIFYNINTRDFAIEQSLSIDDANFNNLSIAPNPNNGSFNISFDSNTGEDINLKVYDLGGRLIMSNSYVNTGRFNQLINLNQVQSGLYILELTEGVFKTTRKIIIE